jgi:hypothetical protein
MKKLLLTLTCAGLMSSAAFAASSFTTNMTNYIISGTSGSFNVTISLNTNVSTISSFDLFLGSNSAGANAFSIFSNTSLQTGSASAGSPSYPDAFAAPTMPANPANYFTFENYDPDGAGSRPTDDLGFSYSTDKTISGGTIQLETLNITYSFGSAPANGTTWTFSTTPSGSTNPAPYGSYFYSNNLQTFNSTGQGMFTVTFVPEPATWSLLGLSGLGTIGLNVLRYRRRKS